MSEYELYHHGVKGQKWGVRRTAAQLGNRIKAKRDANKKERYKRAEDVINKYGGSKGTAAFVRAGKGYLYQIGKNFCTGSAAAATMHLAMNAVNPTAAAIGFVATTAIALGDAGLTARNLYKTGRDVYDIAKHEDDSDYLMHFGVKGQRWGVRRFQDESGALTGLGKQRAKLDADWHPPKKV